MSYSRMLFLNKFLLPFLCVISLFFQLEAEPSRPEKKGPVVLVVGTRPEAIKMLPLYWALKKAHVETLLCSTGQHKELLDNVWKIFSVQPDISLDVMKKDQDLFYLTQTLLERLKGVFQDIKPSLLVVQGDTTSAMVAALSAFYLHIPVAHVEAGLRTGNIYEPFPEEMNRKIITQISSLHFAPTKKDVQNLLRENVSNESIFLVGNTVVDMLHYVAEKLESHEVEPSQFLRDLVDKQEQQGKKILLFTMHRRESQEEAIYRMLTFWKKMCALHPELVVIFPAHPNPKIQQAIATSQILATDNFFVLPPLSYYDMVYLLTKVSGVATDSGGVQEEATSLCKKVFVLRERTDRNEALRDHVELVGTDEGKLENGVSKLLASLSGQVSMTYEYGDGKASERIVSVIKKFILYDNF